MRHGAFGVIADGYQDMAACDRSAEGEPFGASLDVSGEQRFIAAEQTTNRREIKCIVNIVEHW